MSGIKFKKKDLNRYRKVYPYQRKEPRNTLTATSEVTIEIGKVSFNNASSATYTFTETYTSAPTITAVSVDSSSNNTANVNIFISEITTQKATFNSSQAFTGNVHFHIILTEC